MAEQAAQEWLKGPVKVDCENCQPVVDEEPIKVNTHGKSPKVIEWLPVGSAEEITNIVIHDPHGDYEFTPPQPIGAKKWRTVDMCQHDRDYKYDITVRCKDCDEEVTLDPIIRNQDTGG